MFIERGNRESSLVFHVRLFEAIDGSNVWMIQRCQHLGFALEAGEPIRILRKGLRQYFDRDIAIQLFVARPIHLTHSALAQLRADFVTTEFCAGG